jgi:hypothetical protein
MIVLGAAVLALGLAGCGRGGGPGIATAGGAATRSANPSAPAADKADRARQFAQCLRDHGIEVADPDANGEVGVGEGAEVNKRDLGAAYEACRDFAPAKETTKGHELTPAELDQLRQFAQCLRDNGVPDWPDPGPDGDFGNDPAVLRAKNSPHMRSAMETCQHFLPGSNNPGVKGG